jgi:hypothetical protein
LTLERCTFPSRSAGLLALFGALGTCAKAHRRAGLHRHGAVPSSGRGRLGDAPHVHVRVMSEMINAIINKAPAEEIKALLARTLARTDATQSNEDSEQVLHVAQFTGEFATIGVPTALATGTAKVYFEVTLVRLGLDMQLGWAAASFERTTERSGDGADDTTDSWAVDGGNQKAWHDGRTSAWPVEWKEGDVLGFAADLTTGTLRFAQNGEWQHANPFEESAKLPATGNFPALSMGGGGTLRLNLGGAPLCHAGPDQSYTPIMPQASIESLELLRGTPGAVVIQTMQSMVRLAPLTSLSTQGFTHSLAPPRAALAPRSVAPLCR